MRKEEKKSSATREQLINAVKKIRKAFPSAIVTRDFFRQHAPYADKSWSMYWPKFSDMVKEAGCEPKAATPTIEIVKEIPVADKLQFEREKLAVKKEDTKKLLDAALNKLHLLEEERDILFNIRDRTPQVTDILPKNTSGTSESVAVGVFSDWHTEERVLPGDVSYKNEYNLEIAEKRAIKAWQGFFRLWDILRRDTTIKSVVIALIGDFISNTLHEDQAESNLLLPADAIYKAESMIVSGLRFLLTQFPQDVTVTVVCHSGNHGRMTKKQRHTTEAGNSLEQFMYYHLRDFFAGEERLVFQIATGYHSYVSLFDGQYVIRFHHGHDVKYGGGVGGIYIPVNKAIAQWNKATRAVDLDVFGHFHQYIDAGNFVANGSLIGYNAYAVAIKADFEQPQQAFFLVSKKYRSKTMATPIFVSEGS